MADGLSGLADGTVGGLPLYGVRPDGVEGLLAALPATQADMLRLHGFAGAAGALVLLPGADGLGGAVIGLGKAPALHGFGAAATGLPAGSQWCIAPGDFEPEEAVLGFLLGAYRYDVLKSAKKPSGAVLAQKVAARTKILASAVCGARDLINTPANLLGPAELAAAVAAAGAAHKADMELVSGDDLTARYPALAAVGAGSDRPSQVAILRWRGSQAGDESRLVSLCGKGVVFDTGGYDLKPSAAMLRMKKDMGGAAIMLGLARAIMALDLPVRLELRIGCVENSVSGHAMRPSDVLSTRAGFTVEIGNTDAEGRLVLCDLLAEAAEAKPDWLIDAATLTGAARVALGPDLPGLFCTNDELSDMILAAGRAVHDPLWRLPLHEGYDSWLDSNVADINNVATKPMAGAIIAALYLKRFVPAGISWAHVDVYAWNDSARPGRPEGGEAQSLRALLQMIEGNA